MMGPLCIYHSNCADGFGAAWVVRFALGKALGEIDFYPGVYQDSPPDVEGRDVLMVDFSYKRPILEAMAAKARSMLILDHHATAESDLSYLPPPLEGPYSPEAMVHWQRECNAPNATHALFDMNRSGAGITWDYFFPNDLRPPLIGHIEDRDLWRFALPGTREIQAALFSYPYDFEVWDKLMAYKTFDLNQTMRREGQAIERKHFKDIAELVKVCRREMFIGGIVVPAASLPYTLTSDAGHLMATEHPSRIGVCYWDTPQGRVFSLRSTDDGPDVSQIAKQYGGGGHPHAAGFRLSFDEAAKLEIQTP